MKNDLIVVAGGGGFIGGHLVADLIRQGHTHIRAVDIKPLDDWWQRFPHVENWSMDLRLRKNCETALEGAAEVYNLAADMGGMGFIENNKALCMLSVLINTHLLLAAKEHGVRRYFYASSACVYAADKQKSAEVVPLKEEDAYPAMPEDGYGWEKLFSERMCRHFREDFGLVTRVGPLPQRLRPARHLGRAAARRRRPPSAARSSRPSCRGRHEIEIWGDGQQTRSFMFIDDCIKGTQSILHSDILEPINLGSDELVTINGLVDIVEDIAGIKLRRKYNLERPQGRQRPQQRQHADPATARLGAGHPPAARTGKDLRLDLRPGGQQQAVSRVLTELCWT